MSADRTLQTTDRPLAGWLLIACLLFLAVTALVGGALFLLDPSGRTLSIPVNALSGSPFADFLIPGLILFVVLGVYPLSVCLGLYAHRPWAWIAALSVGVALIVWIIVQGAIVGFGHWLQWLYLGLGVIVSLLALLPSVRRVYGVENTGSVR